MTRKGLFGLAPADQARVVQVVPAHASRVRKTEAGSQRSAAKRGGPRPPRVGASRRRRDDLQGDLAPRLDHADVRPERLRGCGGAPRAPRGDRAPVVLARLPLAPPPPPAPGPVPLLLPRPRR